MSNDPYAVIRSGGKQYRVNPGQHLKVERLHGDAGDHITFNDVLMLRGGDGHVAVGSPTVDNASVVAEIIDHTRARKINVFKYKSKVRYRKLHGHRQHQTHLRVLELRRGDHSWTAPEPTPVEEEDVEETIDDQPIDEQEPVEAANDTADEPDADDEQKPTEE